MPERSLFVGRLDGVIGGSAQLVRPTRNNEAQAHAVTLTTSFVAPWARGHGIARALVLAVEETATAEGFAIINLDVRETQHAAIALYERLGYRRWGTHPYYARVGGRWVAGHFYSKVINPALIAEGDGRSDPLSGDRPEGRPVRPPGARRHGAGDRVQRRPGRPGAALRRGRRFAGCTWST